MKNDELTKTDVVKGLIVVAVYLVYALIYTLIFGWRGMAHMVFGGFGALTFIVIVGGIIWSCCEKEWGDLR